MRVLHFSHDNYGVDNLQRTFAIAEKIACHFPEATQLLVTDTPQPSDLKLPERVDFIKLPNTDVSSEIERHAPTLDRMTMNTLSETLILDVARHFKPDIVFVEASQEIHRKMTFGLNHLQEIQVETKTGPGNSNNKNTEAMIRQTISSATLETVS